MRITWVGIYGPDVSRMTFSFGPTKKVMITGLTREFVEGCEMTVDLPPGAEVHEMPSDLDGYVFTIRL